MLRVAIVFLAALASSLSSPAQDSVPSPQDATALEAQYKTCAKHYIPAEKCTPEIYSQLKAKDEAPLDPKTSEVLRLVKEYQSRLKNPGSMQVHTAYATDEGAGQNGMGGMSVSRVVYLTDAWPHRGKGKWMDEGGFGGSLAADHSGSYQVDRWPGFCYKVKAFGKQGDMSPGIDLTEKINQALKGSK